MPQAARYRLPSDVDITNSLEEDDWLGRIYRKYAQETDRRARTIDLCEPFDAVDLWIDPDPNAQLILIWLLEDFRPHEAVVSKLNLVQADVPIGNYPADEVVEWRIPAVKILNEHLELASSVWQAWRAPTPRDWFKLLSTDLSLLPLFRPAAVALLEELRLATGLGATEMRMLELISEGNAGPYDVFPGHEKPTSGGCSTIGRSARCWMAWRVVRRLLFRDWMRGLLRTKCTTIATVTNATSKAGSR